MRTLTRVLVTLTAAAAVAQPAASLTIDNFESGPINVVDLSTTVGSTNGEQSGLLSTDVVGGVRLVKATGSTGQLGASSATALLVPVPVVDDGVAMTTAGVGLGVTDAVGGFEFIYDGIADGVTQTINGGLNIDLTGAPSLDVTFTAVAVTGSVTATIYSGTGGGQQTLALVNGLLSFPMAGFGAVNLADVKSIIVQINQINLGEAPLLTNIAVPVPEPTTGLLLSLGLVGLAIRNRRQG